jgi:hypothetical protein
MMHWRLALLLAVVWLFPAANAAEQAAAYGYPVPEPFTATVVGVPVPELRAKTSDVRLKTGYLKKTVDREIPDALWYNARIAFLYRLQRKPAPLVFVIAGTGGAHNTAHNQLLMRALYDAGMHVVGLASPTHTRFITAAGSTGVPGNLPVDAKDLYVVMKKIREKLDADKKITDFYLTGYSLGGINSAFVARLDKEEGAFGFSRVLMINPPLSLYNSVSRLDRMIQSVPGGIDNFPQFFRGLVDQVSAAYTKSDSVAFDETLFFNVFKANPPGPDELAGLVGAAFRIAASNLITASDMVTNFGFAVPANATATRTSSFTDYYHEMYFPFYQRQQPSLTRGELAELQSLKSIQGFLGEAEYIGVVHNRDDIILDPGEIDFFPATFGERAIIYPTGGHLGNLSYWENVQNIVKFFTEGWQ